MRLLFAEVLVIKALLSVICAFDGVISDFIAIYPYRIFIAATDFPSHLMDIYKCTFCHVCLIVIRGT